MVTPQELPRASALSARADTNTRRYCPICKMDIMTDSDISLGLLILLMILGRSNARIAAADFLRMILKSSTTPVSMKTEDGIYVWQKKRRRIFKNELYPDLGDMHLRIMDSDIIR